jgi:hypothetical protein
MQRKCHGWPAVASLQGGTVQKKSGFADGCDSRFHVIVVLNHTAGRRPNSIAINFDSLLLGSNSRRKPEKCVPNAIGQSCVHLFFYFFREERGACLIEKVQSQFVANPFNTSLTLLVELFANLVRPALALVLLNL